MHGSFWRARYTQSVYRIAALGLPTHLHCFLGGDCAGPIRVVSSALPFCANSIGRGSAPWNRHNASVRVQRLKSNLGGHTIDPDSFFHEDLYVLVIMLRTESHLSQKPNRTRSWTCLLLIPILCSCCVPSPPLLRRSAVSSSALLVLLWCVSSSSWAGRKWPATNPFYMVGWRNGPPSMKQVRHSWREHKLETPLQAMSRFQFLRVSCSHITPGWPWWIQRSSRWTSTRNTRSDVEFRKAVGDVLPLWWQTATTVGELRCPLLASIQGTLRRSVGPSTSGARYLPCDVVSPSRHIDRTVSVRVNGEINNSELLCCGKLKRSNRDVLLHQSCGVHLDPLEIIGLCVDDLSWWRHERNRSPLKWADATKLDGARRARTN